MNDTTIQRMRELAEGAPLDLPAIRWEAPQVTWPQEPYARWGDIGDHEEGLYLLARTTPVVDMHGTYLDLAQAERLLTRLASAISLGRQLETTAGR